MFPGSSLSLSSISPSLIKSVLKEKLQLSLQQHCKRSPDLRYHAGSSGPYASELLFVEKLILEFIGIYLTKTDAIFINIDLFFLLLDVQKS